MVLRQFADPSVRSHATEAGPDGTERFTVTATTLNATGSVSIETLRCHGHVYLEVTTDGEPYPSDTIR